MQHNFPLCAAYMCAQATSSTHIYTCIKIECNLISPNVPVHKQQSLLPVLESSFGFSVGSLNWGAFWLHARKSIITCILSVNVQKYPINLIW